MTALSERRLAAALLVALLACSGPLSPVLAQEAEPAAEAPAPDPTLSESVPDDGLEPAAIITGDAAAAAVTENQANTVQTDGVCGEDCPDGPVPGLYAGNDSAATATNEVEIVSATGENAIASTAGDALIETGDIAILNVILNYINQNFIGYGREYFINIFNKIIGDVDLSGFGGDRPAPDYGVCEGEGCLIVAENKNRLALDNAVVIDADTGSNSIQDAGGAGLVKTGDIDIANNVVNVANLNVTGHNWFFAVINIFGELEGDIIMPAAYDEAASTTLLSALSQELEQAEVGGQGHAADFVVYNSDLADAFNNLKVNASTGGNQALSDQGLAEVMTGQVLSQVHTFNLINFSFTGHDWRFARVNIFGSWDGFVHGLPAGFKVYEDGHGKTVYNDYLLNPDAYPSNVALVSDNDNEAGLLNDFTVNANTGENSVLSGESAAISTGDIRVKSNTFNFLNGNFTGNDWQFSLVNVFGSWQGNLAFGKPDLWVSQSISTPALARPDDYITYRYIFGNKGDALASRVELSDELDQGLVLLADQGGAQLAPDRLFWDIGYLPPNSQGSVSYRVRVSDRLDPGDYTLSNLARISAAEGDRSMADNSARGQVPIQVQSRASKSYLGNPAFDAVGAGVGVPVLAVVKSNDAAGPVKPGDRVNFKISIKNLGTAGLKDVIAVDIMAGARTSVQAGRDGWSIGDLAPKEGVEIEYGVEIRSHIPSDDYVNEVTVEGRDPQTGRYLSGFASSLIKVENDRPAPSGEPQLAIAKIIRSGPAFPGDSVTVEIVVANNGQRTAKNVKVSDSLTNGLIFSDENGIMYKEWFLENLNPGQIERLRYRVQVLSDASPGAYATAAAARADNYPVTAVNSQVIVAAKRAATAAAASYVPPAPRPVRAVPLPAGPESPSEADGPAPKATALPAEPAPDWRPPAAQAAVLGASEPAPPANPLAGHRALAKSALWVVLLLIAYQLASRVQSRIAIRRHPH